MCAYKYINLSAFGTAKYVFLLLWGSEAREHFHCNGIAAHSCISGFKMLHRKDSRRNEYSDLLAAHYSLKCRTECHLGLTESNVTAKKAVHWNGPHHISLYLFNSGKLRLGLLIREGFGKLLFKIGILRECKARLLLPLCIEPYEILGNILCGTFSAGFDTGPVSAPHVRKLYLSVLILFTDIFAYIFKPVTGNEQLIRSCVSYRNIVLGNAVDRNRLHSLEQADTVICVNYVIAYRKIGIAHKSLTCTANTAKHSLSALVCHYRTAEITSHRKHGYSGSYKIVALSDRTDVNYYLPLFNGVEIKVFTLPNGSRRHSVFGKRGY